jgi:hypothetical protein
MQISPKLYVSDKLAKKKDKIIAKISSGKPVLGLYVITEATNGVDLFDIYNYNVTLQRYYKVYKDLTVYGLAKDREDAFELVMKMTEDCIKTDADVDLKSFMEVV